MPKSPPAPSSGPAPIPLRPDPERAAAPPKPWVTEAPAPSLHAPNAANAPAPTSPALTAGPASSAAPAPDTAVCHWTLAGEPVQLLAARALFWPARQRLLLADLHLGKEDTFRRSGLAVPEGVTRADLARLSELLAQTGATSLWVLGDMLHGRPEGQAWRAAWDAFRTRHASTDMRLIAGNHDRHVLRADLGILIDTADAVRDGPFVFTHEPPTEPHARPAGQAARRAVAKRPAARGHASVSLNPPQSGETSVGTGQSTVVVAGHWHPVVRVPAWGRDFPAFVFDGQQLVLPAFSDFTGGLRVHRPHRAAVCVQGHVLDVMPRRRAPT